MSYAERLYILNSLSVISRVIGFDDSDDTVCEALRYLKPLFFCNGGDRSVASIEEHKVCLELNIHEVFDVGGGKIQDSSMLVRRAKV